MKRPCDPPELRPAPVCRQLLAALEGSQGRRRRRRRNTTPDAIGMEIKRRLLEDAVRADPEPEDFEGWLLERCGSAPERLGGKPRTGPGAASGPVRALSLEILAEWRLAQKLESFQSWLRDGAPSDDIEKGPDGAPPSDGTT